MAKKPKTLLLGEIKVELAVTEEKTEFMFRSIPADPLTETGFEQILIATTRDLVTRVMEWEAESPAAAEVKMAARIALGFEET